MNWLSDSSPTLLAIDAPLGWPSELGDKLHDHNAGDFIDSEPNRLFRRETDFCIKQITGKQPLDVGADRIARTAHSALHILHKLREKTGQKILLAWDSVLQEKISAIEVYPAATLKMIGLRSSGYKNPENIEQRKEIVNGLRHFLDLKIDASVFGGDDDMLDAVVCVLAGSDFLAGKTVQPGDIRLAKKEGWIWVCQ